MDSTGDMQKDLKDLKKQNKILDDKLDGQAAHIQVLEDKLTLTNTLLQQLVDKANQPTTALPTPANLTNPPDALATNLASPDQVVVASNGHTSNGN